jgi:hypothetical protein
MGSDPFLRMLTDRMHPFKFCTQCQENKPPEGGIDVKQKWHCQHCWIKRITGKYLRQNATPQTT